jgi:uncharacterized protein (TIGR03118 family)
MKKCLLLFTLGLTAALSYAQQSGYSQTNLVADTAGIAAHTDSQLSNPWGIAVSPEQLFWIANNNGGMSTLYDASGNKNSIVVQIPTASVNPCSVGCPTGIVANSFGADFGGAQFIFDTEDGILASWSQGVVGTTVVDNSAAGAVYKGLALLSNGAGNFLLAANFHSGKVDVFDRAFKPASLAGSFTDPNLPASFAPHGIHIINNQVFVAYAMQDGPKHDPVIGAGNGLVDTFDMNGNFVRRFAIGGMLNAPWGVAQSPASFGQFSNAMLVGDFGDGTINAFDANGNLMGQLKDTGGNVLVNPGLWELLFGQTSADAQTLYFTAGGADQTHGLFATLKAAQAVSSGDFSLALSSTAATVSRGGATNISVSASAVGGFNSAITLSCSGLPAGVTCAFSPDVITPGTNSATSVLTLSVAQTYNPIGMWLPFSGIGLFGLAFATPEGDMKSRKRLLKRSAIVGAVVLIAVLLLMAAGCSSNAANHMNSMNNGNASFLITGISGSVMHSVQVMLTVQ